TKGREDEMARPQAAGQLSRDVIVEDARDLGDIDGKLDELRHGRLRHEADVDLVLDGEENGAVGRDGEGSHQAGGQLCAGTELADEIEALAELIDSRHDGIQQEDGRL